MMRARGIVEGLGILRDESTSWRDAIAAAEVTATKPKRSRLQIAQAADITDWLPNDLLTKLDRCLMAHGVEGRTPFLDTQVAEAVFRLPDSLKIQRQHGKWILRRWLDRIMPSAGAFERKRGFTVPVGEWIFKQGANLGPLVAANPAIAEACHPNQQIKFQRPEGVRGAAQAQPSVRRRPHDASAARAGNGGWFTLHDMFANENSSLSTPSPGS